MELAKLQILREKEGAFLVFDESRPIAAMFNPDELSFNRSVSWAQKTVKDKDLPELQFTGAEPRTLSIKLIFDTYDTPSLPKDDVREHTDAVFKLTTLEAHGSDNPRPPLCRLRWGKPGYFFQGVLERLDQKFTLFMEDGTPVRATLTCSFKEWETNYKTLNEQARQSSAVAKVKVVRRGDSLSSIAAEEYRDPAKWRPIATANGIDDPLRLSTGAPAVLKLPLKRQR